MATVRNNKGASLKREIKDLVRQKELILSHVSQIVKEPAKKYKYVSKKLSDSSSQQIKLDNQIKKNVKVEFETNNDLAYHLNSQISQMKLSYLSMPPMLNSYSIPLFPMINQVNNRFPTFNILSATTQNLQKPYF